MSFSFDVPGGPYAWPAGEKRLRLRAGLTELTRLHRERCPAYADMLSKVTVASPGPECSHPEAPALPVTLFKLLDLKSIPDSEVAKTLTSSGTTGQAVSRIALDRDTAVAQTKALAFIVRELIGPARLPMVYVDHPGVVKNRAEFSARGAGLLGFSSFGRDHMYLLDEATMQPDWDALREFERKHAGGPVLFFGFTFMVWAHMAEEALKAGVSFRFPHAVLVHGGGWKKLEQRKVDNEVFKATLRERFGIPRVANYYGMVEQAGSIFVECEHGVLHAPVFADVFCRDELTLAELPFGKRGLLQVVSLLPRSYPGHSLLTEDIGEVLGEDDCPCGRHGRYFRIHGRAARAELRGCSDTHAANWEARHG